MRALPLTLAREVSGRSVNAIAPVVPGFHPGSHKRNVVVLLTYLLGLCVALGVLQTLLASA